MQTVFHCAVQTLCRSAARPALHRPGPGEDSEEDEEGLELPVNPDQGTPLIPDEEGEVTVPA